MAYEDMTKALPAAHHRLTMDERQTLWMTGVDMLFALAAAHRWSFFEKTMQKALFKWAKMVYNNNRHYRHSAKDNCLERKGGCAS